MNVGKVRVVWLGEDHVVIEKSKRLERFRQSLLFAFKEFERVDKLWDEQPEKAFDEARKPFYYCWKAEDALKVFDLSIPERLGSLIFLETFPMREQ